MPEADVYDSHAYEQNVAAFAQRHGRGQAEVYRNPAPDRRPVSIPYRGQPYFVSEFGGTWWNPQAPDAGGVQDASSEDSWGYGERPAALEEFYARFDGLCRVLLDNPAMFGYCYTQLTDVYQEQNGVYTFDRRPKFDLARLHATQTAPAAIEEEQARRSP